MPDNGGTNSQAAMPTTATRMTAMISRMDIASLAWEGSTSAHAVRLLRIVFLLKAEPGLVRLEAAVGQPDQLPTNSLV
jgi:hypothetical protein